MMPDSGYKSYSALILSLGILAVYVLIGIILFFE